ncbi:MAG: hypothetical protein U9P72_00025 [Campylobacterota bacterium]|nr:hypothetical protein [Campylobacterota bacterium]
MCLISFYRHGEDQNKQLEVICKTGENSFKKHFLGLSDNVTYFAEQLNDVEVNVYNYEVVFKPQAIIPNLDFRGSLDALEKAVTPDNND